MAIQPPSHKGPPSPAAAIQQTILQHAQSVVASQTNQPRTTRQEALMQNTDFITPDVAENDIPPPAYGDTYGEICNEKDGLSTSAFVTDDGRVNIRINHLNRRLSGLFTPALSQQPQGVQDNLPHPSACSHHSEGEEKALPPPSLNIVIQVVGSRGDVQPFVALGKVLKDTYGHRVRLATHSNFKKFVEENGLEFFNIGGDPSRLMAFMVKNPSLMPGFRSLLSGDVGQQRRDVAEYIQGCWRSCFETGDGVSVDGTEQGNSEDPGDNPSFKPAARPFIADCIIANPPSFAHIHCAEKLGIPLHIMFTMPYSPTQAFPHPLANIQSSNADPQLTNYISYVMIELLSWQGLGDIINRFRKKCLGLDPVSLIWAPGMLQRLKIPHTYCWSPALIPKPKDWGPHVSISGFYFLNLASSYTPAAELQAYLDAGPPPVYIGFGSIVLDDPDAMTELIFDAVRKTGQRVVLSKGWGGLGLDSLRLPDGVFMLGNVPHDWLFKHVSCVVHHGGAGTTAAGIAAGRPTVIVPFFGDQPFWGAMIARAGAGPDPIPCKQLTADKLADAINFCLRPERLERAKELAGKIAAEQGSVMGAQSFHQYLEVDRLRCTLEPSRHATWRIKRTQVRLSAFAACTLVEANLLDFHDLKLFRPQEYSTDEGPWDPVSGGAAACFRAFSSMAMGVAEFPSETLKPLHMPIGSSRNRPGKAFQKAARKTEASNVSERELSFNSPEQSRTSLTDHETRARPRGPSNLSDRSFSTSNTKSSLTCDVLQGTSSFKQNNSSRSELRNQNESDYRKDHDLLRQTGVHMSKGLGRIAKATVQAPMEISVGLTKGFHNFPKMWGDDTVRPHEQIKDFKSGAMAAGKEFGLGWYDGVSGLVIQPWKGAQKEGPSGFIKGIGKGIGGFVMKPLAGFSGVLSHTMKGVHKEVQKLFGSNIEDYLVASRASQGYEDWLQSSDAEKQDIIDRWTLIKECLKEKHDPDKIMQDILRAHRLRNIEHGAVRHSCENTASSDHASSDQRSINMDLEESLVASVINENAQLSAHGSLCTNTQENSIVDQVTEDDAFQLQRQQELADYEAYQEDLRQAIVSSEAEARQHESEILEYNAHLKRAMAQSLREEIQKGCQREWAFDMTLNNEAGKVLKRTEQECKMAEKGLVVKTDGPSSTQEDILVDQGNFGGTRRTEFERRQQPQQGEKTRKEKEAEEIVLEYVRKQSLLEQDHQNKGKNRTNISEL